MPALGALSFGTSSRSFAFALNVVNSSQPLPRPKKLHSNSDSQFDLQARPQWLPD